jgi:hypothetical protein
MAKIMHNIVKATTIGMGKKKNISISSDEDTNVDNYNWISFHVYII